MHSCSLTCLLGVTMGIKAELLPRQTRPFSDVCADNVYWRPVNIISIAVCFSLLSLFRQMPGLAISNTGRQMIGRPRTLTTTHPAW